LNSIKTRTRQDKDDVKYSSLLNQAKTRKSEDKTRYLDLLN